MKNNKAILGVVVLIAILAFVFYLFYFKTEPKPLVNNTIDESPTIENGRQCYTFNHEATSTEPYAVNEFLDINVDGLKVTGTKTGTQKGPDMTNGYEGSILGTVNKDIINSVFSYIIEGSKNKEEEIYKIREDKIGLEKLRYPLVEKDGILVPDTTKEFKTMLYTRVGCTASN
jgi:hypothetical protein